ncbi:unnamed protein product [Thelazia callipaeda]|uniref:RING finger protein 141 n=1 Tax=Thelazia callipaeda TaxID=103827 RepID=A0A0N5CUN5_THECL|nr:unnamed protein product [Thelazia callipaeda]
MGQDQSMFSKLPFNSFEMLAMTWTQFVQLIIDLNKRCAELADARGRRVLFAIKKGSADTFLWKLTVRICSLKNNAKSADSYRVFTFGQFLNLRKSLNYLLEDAALETCEVLFREHSPDSHHQRICNSGTCIICMERTPDVILPCVHAYCSLCIEQWKAIEKDWCPLCRHPLQLDGSDTWVVPDHINKEELRHYLMSLTESR